MGCTRLRMCSYAGNHARRAMRACVCANFKGRANRVEAEETNALLLRTPTTPNVEHDDNDEVDHGAENDKEGPNLETRGGVVVEADGEGAVAASLVGVGGSGR